MPPDSSAYLNIESIKNAYGEKACITRNTHESHFYTEHLVSGSGGLYSSCTPIIICISIGERQETFTLLGFFGKCFFESIFDLHDIDDRNKCKWPYTTKIAWKRCSCPYCFAYVRNLFFRKNGYTNPLNQLRAIINRIQLLALWTFLKQSCKVFSSCTHKEKHKGY